MKRLSMLFILVSARVLGQENEFALYENGLIYDNSTMQRLGHIVDSMNIRFRNCEPHTYYSLCQGFATRVRVPSQALRNKLRKGLSWTDFEKNYPTLIEKRNAWITTSAFVDDQGNRKVYYAELPADGDAESLELDDTNENNKTSGWVISDDEKKAWYLHNLKATSIPERYGRFVQYVDCMIDTTVEIFLGKEARFSRYEELPVEVTRFLEMTNEFPSRPTEPEWDKLKEDEYEQQAKVYYKQYNTWDSLRRLELRKRLKGNPEYRKRLHSVMEAALTHEASNDELEEYVAAFISKEDALNLKRHRLVWGSCSMDLSPRYHAMKICMLAAETARWDIFLRSHLDIMNDNVNRVSDGSWAWAGRKTYLKELEALDIDAVDLLLGSCLRVEGVGKNHYYSSIARAGRALAETSQPEELETRLISMILDNDLDMYNRLLTSYLFANYIFNHPDKTRIPDLKQQLEDTIAKTPQPIRDAWRKVERGD